jgi:SAM-dependent methyltransferase
MKKINGTTEFVREYYGKQVKEKNHLKTKACCCSDQVIPQDILKIEQQLDNEILAKYYGCGSPIPPALQGRVILDLGCGTGKDVFVASRFAGPEGYVIGIDMTDEQLEVAQRHLKSQTEKFGYSAPNVEFKKGYIEDLKPLHINDNSVDVVISNCVINLSTDKKKVFSEIFRVLKPGGELYFSDVFTGRRIPEHLKSDPLLYSECLGGALYIEDFRRLMKDVGCPDYRIVSKQRIRLDNPEIEAQIGMIDFYSITVRAFKMESLEDLCEDYGQSAVYIGTIPGFPHFFELDEHHRFVTGKTMLVCGNTASMLNETRFADHFIVHGDRSVHYGPFNCAPLYKKQEQDEGSGGTCC